MTRISMTRISMTRVSMVCALNAHPVMNQASVKGIRDVATLAPDWINPVSAGVRVILSPFGCELKMW
jgi:hypothetical protein